MNYTAKLQTVIFSNIEDDVGQAIADRESKT